MDKHYTIEDLNKNKKKDEETPLISASINDLIINETENEEQVFKKLSKKRKGILGLSYTSYIIPSLYAFFLFVNVYSFLSKLNDEHVDEKDEFPLHLFLQILNLLMTGVSAASDLYTNVIATTAVPELAYDWIHGEEDSALFEDNVYAELSEIKQKIVRGSLYASKFFAHGSFVIVGWAAVDALFDYIKNLPVKIGLAAVIVPLGAYYGGLLLYNKTKQHHIWMISRMLAGFKGLGTYAKKPVELLEFNMQLLSNIFYKMLTFGFVSAAALKRFNIKDPVANVSIVGISAFLGGFQTLFTRFKPSKTFILDAEVKQICGDDYKFFTANRISNLAFGLVRSAGIIYLLWRYSKLDTDSTIILCSAIGLPLVIQNMFFSLRVQNTLKKNELGGGFLGVLNGFTNFMARSLRVGAIMVFTQELSEFLRANGIELDINELDSIMISMASVGVESINWHFYKDALKDGVTYWKEKVTTEKQYAETKNLSFSWPRLFSRSKKEYLEINSSCDKKFLSTTEPKSFEITK